MFRTSVNYKTTMTFSILVFALASLFAIGPIIGNQQAMAANAGGIGFEGGGGLGGGFLSLLYSRYLGTDTA